MNAIEAHDLVVEVKPHFWSTSRQILRGVSLEVQRGEVFGFLGPNGAGKTTTIKTLLGLMLPSAGSIRLLGGEIDDPNVRARIGFMPEHAYFADHLTGREVILQHALLAGLGYKDATHRCGEVLEQVGLAEAATQRLASYSKGMLQRVGIAQAIVGDPELVILDEPMSGLDPIGRRDIRSIMTNLREQGKTVFFSTHILPDVEMICDRVAILVNGVVRRIGELDSLLGGDEAVDTVDVVADAVPEETQIAGSKIALSAQRRGNAVSFSAATLDSANELVDILRRGGARIRSIQTHRRSLEDVFMRETEARES